MPRPGFVLDVDRSTPPILFHHGENFRFEKLPAGRSRVIYPPSPTRASTTSTRPSARRSATRWVSPSHSPPCCMPG